MTSRTPKETYDRNIARLRGETPDDDRRDNVVYGDEIPAADRDRIEQFILAYNDNDPRVPTPAGESGKSYNTLARYAVNLLRVADRTSLTDATADDINQATADLVSEGRSKSTVRQVQMTARTFYRYHDDLGVDPDDIATFPRPEATVDDRDMLTRDEIRRLEDALDHPRDLCIFHLLLYTGMRVGAVRTLRVKDVEPESGPSGRYWLNTDADGLKNADRNGGARPLLGAKAAVRDWLKYHPTGDPDHYLITQHPKYRNPEPTVAVTAELPRRMLKKAKEQAGITKPLHPHMLRHNFVTICKRDYDMADEDVKYLIGHAPRSRVMETTYQHLSDEDHIDRAEASADYTEREPASPLTPEKCDVCGNHLADDARACDRCGNVFSPDAHAAKQQLEADMKRDLRDTDPNDADTVALIEEFDKRLDDPAFRAALLERLGGGSGDAAGAAE